MILPGVLDEIDRALSVGDNPHMNILAFLAPMLVHVLEAEGPKAVEYLLAHLQKDSPKIIAWIESELQKLEKKP